MLNPLRARFLVCLLLPLLLTSCSYVLDPELLAEQEAAAQAVAQAPEFAPSSICIVPTVTGLDQVAAEGLLIGSELQPVKMVQYDDEAANGSVLSQDPPAGTRLDPCRGEVLLVVSLGAQPQPTNTPAPTANPRPTDRLFWDDFNEGVKPEWDATMGDWRIVAARFQPIDTVDGYAIVHVGSDEWENYTVDLDVGGLQDGRKSNDYIALLARIQTNGDLVYGSIGPDYFTCGFFRDDESHTLITGNLDHVSEEHHARIEVEGNVYRFFVDGIRVCVFEDDTFARGKVGVETWNGYGDPVWFDNYQVQNLPSSE